MAHRQKSSYVTEKSQQEERQGKENTRCVFSNVSVYTTAKRKYGNSKDVPVYARGTELILLWQDTPCSDTDPLNPGPQCTLT